MYSNSMLSCLLIFFLCLFHCISCTPSALSLNPSANWYGDDGTWSAISIRVGTPQQWVDVFVSTASSETWVVSPGGCDGTSTCTSKRGGLFQLNESSTWQGQGVFELGLDTQLGFGGDADYGLDTLEFGTTGIALKDTIVGSINTTDYWLGFFGLGDIPGNFTNIEVSPPLSALENQTLIPSNSYSYTAGAIYQAKSVPCSLTLGGYDANRFTPHDISFQLNPTHQPETWLNSISVSSGVSTGLPQNWTSNSLQLLEPADGVYVTIDSSTPFLWLPKSVCESFAEALGLSYNDSLALYTFDGNASTHDDLQSLKLNFTFSLSDTSTPTEVVNITLPYAAFDLQLSYPYIPNTTYQSDNKYYFPLRQAANDTQYVIGRAFLQEAYLITDYDRGNFSVYQALHPSNPGNVSIVDILKPTASSPQQVSPPSTNLSTPIIAGIAVGSATVLILLAILIFFIYRRHRRAQKHAIIIEPKPAITSFPSSPPSTTAAITSTSLSPSSPSSKLSPSTVHSYSAPQSALSPGLYEADSRPRTPVRIEISADASHERFELPAPSRWPEELDGRRVYAPRGDQDKFASEIDWERENTSGAKCRPSMRLNKAGEGVYGAL